MKDIDPMVALCISMFQNRGAYALLLGSGISKASGMPSGYDVVQDLIVRLAKVQSEDAGSDPFHWFKNKYKREPEYTFLLDRLTKTPAERSLLLKRYFEPYVEEGRLGTKMPSLAHRAIAELVSLGFVRIIITTNFDRLLEKALEERGVIPAVISNSDSIKGVMPLMHSGPVIIKANGDYMDLRTRNTKSELTAYEPEMKKLLRRVLDESGLIVCGWSGEWDIALRSALKQAGSRTFGVYWTYRERIPEAIKKLSRDIGGQFIRTEGADTFFPRLLEGVKAQDELSTEREDAKVSHFKLLLSDPSKKIELHEYMMKQAELLYNRLSDEKYPVDRELSAEEYKRRRGAYEKEIMLLQKLYVLGNYWGDKACAHTWVETIELLANPKGEYSENNAYSLRHYPYVLLLYSLGIATLAGNNYETFSALMRMPRIKIGYNIYPPALGLYPYGPILKLKSDRELPLCSHIYNVLREPLRDIMPSESNYQRFFDLFEYLFTLLHADSLRQMHSRIKSASVCISSRKERLYAAKVSDRVKADLTEKGRNAIPLRLGLFGEDENRLRRAIADVDMLSAIKG